MNELVSDGKKKEWTSQMHNLHIWELDAVYVVCGWCYVIFGLIIYKQSSIDHHWLKASNTALCRFVIFDNHRVLLEVIEKLKGKDKNLDYEKILKWYF